MFTRRGAMFGAASLVSTAVATRAGAADFDLSSEAAVKLIDAVARLPKRGGARLRISPGIYRFPASTKPALQFDDIENLSVDARGAVFLFRESSPSISAVNCPNFRLKGGTIDWERPPFSQGEVTSVAADKRALEINVDAAFPVTGAEHIETLATYDRASGLMSLGGIDSYNSVESVQLTGVQRLHLALSQPLDFKRGDTVVMRHQTYGVNAISLDACKDVSLQDITIHAAPGMAVIGSACDGVVIERLRIEPALGRLMSTCADGIHLLGCRGKILIEDCTMRGMGDDGVNVLTPYLRIDQIVNSRTLAVSTRNHWWISEADVIPPAHDVVFLSGRNFKALGKARARASEPGRVEVIHLDQGCPPDLKPGDLVMDATANQHELEIRGCQFPGNRARGVLAHDNTTIVDCSFANQFESAILLSQSSWWLEGGPINAVTIDRCHFSGTSRRDAEAAAIHIDSHVDFNGGEAEVSDPAPFGSVSISNCSFDRCHGPAVLAHAIDELRVTRNEFRNMPPGVISIKDVERPVFSGNTCAPPGSIIDPDHKADVSLAENNTGLHSDNPSGRDVPGAPRN